MIISREKAGFEHDEEAMNAAVREDIMLHAYMLTQSGIPMLYSGDELGQVNDYSYKNDPEKCADSRYIHRGKLPWEFAEDKEDMLTTVVLAAKCPKLVAPAMNTGMLENPITQDNLATLERYGFTVIPSESGVLACKDVGSGRLPKEEVLLEHILHTIARPKDLAGLRIAVTAGPTQEALDPVRYLTNHSTGKMGYALARAAAMRGAEVTLIHGQTALPPVKFTTDVPVTTARQMYEAVTDRFDTTDVLIMAAAVADYRPATVADDKIKKKEGDLSIPVERTEDILGTIGPRKTHQFLCGFSMETRDLVENSSAKLAKKNLDMVVANNLKVAGAGFGVDTNVVTFITPDGTRELPLMSKADVADAILDEILRRRAKK